MKCRSLQQEPDWLKALVYKKSWSGCFGQSVKIRYSYHIEPVANYLATSMIAEGFAEKPSDLVSIESSDTRDIIENAMAIWESIANVKFVADDADPIFHIFGYKPSTSLAAGSSGLSTLPRAMIPRLAISTNLLHILDEYLNVIFHELGHMLGLIHPFESMVSGPHQNSTAFSVMNYNDPEYAYGLKAYPVTPMPADYYAMQFIYGANRSAGTGDTIYYLHDYDLQIRFSFTHVGLMATLPWDNDGTDTISSEKISDYAVMDIRVNGVSAVKRSLIITPNISIENIVAGNCRNAIILNELSNNVDVRQSTRTFLFFAPPRIGRDVIDGFKPANDKLIFTTTTAELSYRWKIQLDKRSNNTNTTIINFGQGNNIKLLGIHPDELRPDTIEVRIGKSPNSTDLASVHPYIKELYSDQFDFALDALSNAYEYGAKPLVGGACLSGGIILTGEMLKRRGYQQNTIACAILIGQCLPAALRGNFAAVGCIVATRFVYDNEFAVHLSNGMMLGGAVASCGSIGDVAVSVVKVVASAAMGFFGSKLAYWVSDQLLDSSDVSPAEHHAKMN